MCYADEQITVRSSADKSVLFTGIIKGLKFMFNYSSDNVKENNTVECNIPGLTACKYYTFHILGAGIEECRGQYNRVYEEKSTDFSHDNYSQHIFCFEKTNGEVLFTAKLLKIMPNDWFEAPGGSRRQRPPYSLLNNEKTQGIGYAENIYLNPIKQLVAAGIKGSDDVQLTCDAGNWHYLLEEYIASGRMIYPDGRMVIVESSDEDEYWFSHKLFRPGVIVKNYVELGGEKVWYVAEYSPDCNDNKAKAKIIFHRKGVLLKFKGSFIRQSFGRIKKASGRIRGYVAYYRIQGTISTVEKDGGEVSEYIDLYNDGINAERIALSLADREIFSNIILDAVHPYAADENCVAATKPIDLDDLIGLESVKETFAELKKFGSYQQAVYRGLDPEEKHTDKLLEIYKQKNHMAMTCETKDKAISLHMAFLGSPGTGKTTVAERVASMLKNYGLIVTNDIPVVVVKSDLVGPYIGHTEEIVRKKIDEALGGILFVDEAPTLFESGSNDFGKIALNEIMYAMEHHRDKLIVILAGYTDEMMYMLKNANPGLTSRIPWYFYFNDYSVEEMWEILERKVYKDGYRFDAIEAAAIKVKVFDYFAMLKQELDGVKEDGKIKHFFGNGRGVRTFFNFLKIGLAVRIDNSATDSDLLTIKLEDIDFAYGKFKAGPEKLTEKKASRIGFQYS